MKGFAGYSIKKDAFTIDQKALIDYQLIRGWRNNSGAFEWKDNDSGRTYLVSNQKNKLMIMKLGKKNEISKGVLWGSSRSNIKEVLNVVYPNQDLDTTMHPVEQGKLYYIDNGEVFDATTKLNGDADVLGKCLTCGAEDGQPCFRNCGKVE